MRERVRKRIFWTLGRGKRNHEPKRQSDRSKKDIKLTQRRTRKDCEGKERRGEKGKRNDEKMSNISYIKRIH